MLPDDASLVDVAFAVCTALDRAACTAVLTGGSAATYYSNASYQSLDADFVFQTNPERKTLDAVLESLGFQRTATGFYAHERIRYTIEFPRGPLAIGRDIVRTWSTIRRGDERLFVTSVTDCVRDRFMHFWAWNDRSALDVALQVARSHADEFDLAAFLEWTTRERRADRAYDRERVDEFVVGYISTRPRAVEG